MTTGLTEDDLQRIREFVERSPRNRGPDVLCPGKDPDSDPEDAHE
ncbi:hypothetical protein [Haloplanus salinarum]